jgi:hypothetical protein
MWLILPSAIGLAVSAEFGWRGFLIPHLMKLGMAPLRVSSFIGVLHAIYTIIPTVVQHHDLISSGSMMDNNPANFLNKVSIVMLYGPSISFPVNITLCWIYFLSKGSLLLTTLSHGYLYATIYLIGDELFDGDLSVRVQNVSILALLFMGLSIVPAIFLLQDGIDRNKRQQERSNKEKEKKSD